LNREKIWKLWKKSKLNSEKIWKIWKKPKLNSEKIYFSSIFFISFHNFLLYFPNLFTTRLAFLPYFPNNLTMSSIFSLSFHYFLLYFPNVFTIRLTYLPYFPNHFTIQQIYLNLYTDICLPLAGKYILKPCSGSKFSYCSKNRTLC
jgi:hypothetical protein